MEIIARLVWEEKEKEGIKQSNTISIKIPMPFSAEPYKYTKIHVAMTEDPEQTYRF